MADQFFGIMFDPTWRWQDLAMLKAIQRLEAAIRVEAVKLGAGRTLVDGQNEIGHGSLARLQIDGEVMDAGEVDGGDAPGNAPLGQHIDRARPDLAAIGQDP